MEITEKSNDTFVKDALKDHFPNLLCTMIRQIDVLRKAAKAGETLTEPGEEGLMRMLEIWLELAHPTGIVAFEAMDLSFAADLLALLYDAVIYCLPPDRQGLALCVELEYLMESLCFDVWWE